MSRSDYLDFRVISHGNEPCVPLMFSQTQPINPAADAANDQPDDKSVCSGLYRDAADVGSVVKNESTRDSLDQDTVDGPSHSIPAACLSMPDNDRRSEYSNLPLHDGNCDNAHVPVEINAVLLELPTSNMISPPPPYTLVRGRRMRFLPQQIHLPSDAGNFSVMQHYPDFFQRHRPMEATKNCCNFLMVSGSLNVRWFIIVISFIALCCVVVGIVLGALKGANEFTGDDSLTISLLLIGVGIILLTVSGIAWRLTTNQSPDSSLRRMLGFGSVRATSPALQSFRRAPSGPFAAYVLRNSFGRSCPPTALTAPGYCYEFQFRPPPPSYYASMADYRVRTLLDRNECRGADRTPPPDYRRRTDPVPLLNQLHITNRTCPQQQLASWSVLQPSAPPSYRSGSGRESRERTSLQQVNAIFNENYTTGIVYEEDGITLSRFPREESRTRYYNSADHTSSAPKASLGSSIELLAQL